MCNPIQNPASLAKSINAKKQKYDKLPTKQVIDTHWEYSCVDLIGPYTLKGKKRSEIDFMCLNYDRSG